MTMRALFQLAFLALLASTFTGCFDNRPISRVDSGPVVVPMDGGPIVLQDSGPGCVPESSASACTDFADNDCDGQIDCNDISCCSSVSCATGTLCGNMRVDAGVDAGPGTCGTVTYLDPLHAGCMPRCSASTGAVAESCTTSQCLADAVNADTTPGRTITLRAPDGSTTQMVTFTCGTCVAYQQETCMYDSCPSEYATWASCDETTDADACDGEITTLNSCLSASAGYETCFFAEVFRCFP
jgi:hypothetical protein